MTKISKFKRLYPWLIWALGAAFFFVEYFARVAPSVMVPELMREFNLSALGVGAMSAVFYYAYIAMQVPVGALVDRFGPRRLLAMTAIICALGCYVFATANSVMELRVARFLIGFGAAFAFVGALKLATVWFSAARIGLLAGLTQALGMLGAAMGEGPLSFSVSSVGWRHTILTVGEILFVLAVLIGITVRDHPRLPRKGIPHVKKSPLIESLVTVIKNPQSWINAAFIGLLYAPTAAFGELWGVRYLVRVHGFTTHIAASAVSVIFLGWAVGSPILGWISDRMQLRKPAMAFSVVMSFIFLSAVLFIPALPKVAVFALLFFYGVCNTAVAISYAVASELNPRAVAGTSMAFANMASVLIGATLQPVIGWLLVKRWHGVMLHHIPVYSAYDFRMAMLALPGCLVLAFLAVLGLRETRCHYSK